MDSTDYDSGVMAASLSCGQAPAKEDSLAQGTGGRLHKEYARVVTGEMSAPAADGLACVCGILRRL